MIFIAILVVLGLTRRQPRRYWAHAAVAVAVQFIIGLLFYGGGTLEDPTGDGLVTAWVRRLTNDGPAMGLFAIGVIALAWGVPIWIVVRGYERKRPLSSSDAVASESFSSLAGKDQE